MGAVVTTLSLAACALIAAADGGTFWLLTFVYGFVVTFGLSIFYLAAIIIIPHGFEHNIGMAIGLTVSGSGVGQAVFSCILSKAIDAYGWQGASLVISAVSAHLFVCVVLYPASVIERIKDSNRRPPHTNTSITSLVAERPTVFANRLCLLYLSSSLFMTGFNIPYIYLADLIIIQTNNQHISVMAAYACMGITMTIGQIFFGFLAYNNKQTQISPVFIYTTSNLASAISILLVLVKKSIFVMSHAASFGFFTSGSHVLMLILTKKASGTRFSLVLGITQFCQGIGIIVGLPMGGFLKDMSGSYTWTFLFASIVMTLSALVMLTWPISHERQTNTTSVRNRSNPPDIPLQIIGKRNEIKKPL